MNFGASRRGKNSPPADTFTGAPGPWCLFKLPGLLGRSCGNRRALGGRSPKTRNDRFLKMGFGGLVSEVWVQILGLTHIRNNLSTRRHLSLLSTFNFYCENAFPGEIQRSSTCSLQNTGTPKRGSAKVQLGEGAGGFVLLELLHTEAAPPPGSLTPA